MLLLGVQVGCSNLACLLCMCLCVWRPLLRTLCTLLYLLTLYNSHACTLPVADAGMSTCSASATNLRLAAAARPCCPCQQSLSCQCYSLCADRVTAVTVCVPLGPRHWVYSVACHSMQCRGEVLTSVALVFAVARKKRLWLCFWGLAVCPVHIPPKTVHSTNE